MLSRTRIALATAAVLVSGLAVAVAQAAEKAAANPNLSAQNHSATSRMAETTRGTQTDVDLFLIPCLIDTNRAEVALGDIAEQRGQSRDVKSFAQEMVKDHTALEKQARQLQDTLTRQLHPQNPANTPVAATLFQIGAKIDQACLASSKRALEQQSEADFDRVYMGMQIGMHQRAADVLAVFNEYATFPQLKQAIAHASQIVNQHLERAQKVWNELERPQQPQQAQQHAQEQR